MDKQETRIKVLIAAADLFALRGYHQVSVREICDAAGVTKPVLYYYFKDKDDLLMNLVTDLHTRFNELFNRFVIPGESFDKNLEGLYNSYLTYALNYPYLIRLSALIFFSPLPDRIKLLSLKKAEEMSTFINGIFEKGKAEGFFDEDFNSELAALNFLGPVTLLIARSVLQPETGPPITKTLNEYFVFWKKVFLKHDIQPE